MPRDLLERIAAESHGKLVAFLAIRSGHDIATAEDAVADAYVRAIEAWSECGIPNRPEAWLLTTARRRMIDIDRRQNRFLNDSNDSIAGLVDPAHLPDVIPDERLQLMFACAHPAIQVGDRTPLVLQAVLGVTAEKIASAFLVSPAAMSQRLVRAKQKVRDAGIKLTLPDEEHLSDRLQTVRESIYAAFSAGDLMVDDAELDLSDESIRLARLLVELLPAQPESLGLLALLLYIDARRAARRSSDGLYVPLDQQNAELWNHDQVDQAEKILESASRLGRPGRYQLEAAIQSAHMQRRHGGPTPWDSIVDLYEALEHCHQATGVRVARSAAMLQAGRGQEALRLLDELPTGVVSDYQPYWAIRAHLLIDVSPAEANECFTRAIGLSPDPAVRAYLTARKISMTS